MPAALFGNAAVAVCYPHTRSRVSCCAAPQFFPGHKHLDYALQVCAWQAAIRCVLLLLLLLP
jgi:hypothetical protein